MSVVVSSFDMTGPSAAESVGLVFEPRSASYGNAPLSYESSTVLPIALRRAGRGRASDGPSADWIGDVADSPGKIVDPVDCHWARSAKSQLQILEVGVGFRANPCLN